MLFGLLKFFGITSIAPQTSATSSDIFVKTKPQAIFRAIGISISIVCFLIAPGSNSATPARDCPLPENYLVANPNTTTTSSSNTMSNSDTNTKSPEKGPGPLKALCHKPGGSPNIILCLPPSAYNAHIQHGDTPLPSYTCTKEGNQGPCGP